MRLRSGSGQAVLREVDREEMDEFERTSRRYPDDADDAGEESAASLLPAGDTRVDPRVAAAFEESDSLVRAVRTLRSSLTGLYSRDGAPVCTIAMLSIDAAREGAICAANLAVVFAQGGYNTVLVDANLSYPVHDRLFRSANETGIAGILGGHAHWRDAVHPTAIANLSLITTGGRPANVADVLERSHLSEALQPVADKYDYLVLDCTNLDPLEARLATAGVDGALIVVRQNHSSASALRQLIDQLETAEIPVIGTVLAQ